MRPVDRGFAFSKAGDKCEACGPNCADCETPGMCTSCEDSAEASTVLINGRCEPCPDNCNACTDTKTCTACKPSYGAVNGSCVACTAPECLRCDGDPAKCSKCYPGGAASGTCKECAVAVRHAVHAALHGTTQLARRGQPASLRHRNACDKQMAADQVGTVAQRGRGLHDPTCILIQLNQPLAPPVL